MPMPYIYIYVYCHKCELNIYKDIFIPMDCTYTIDVVCRLFFCRLKAF